MAVKLIAVVLIAIFTAGNATADTNNQCWRDGYQKGRCDSQGKNSWQCMPTFSPRPPVPPLGRHDCKSRFADGYKTGRKKSNG